MSVLAHLCPGGRPARKVAGKLFRPMSSSYQLTAGRGLKFRENGCLPMTRGRATMITRREIIALLSGAAAVRSLSAQDRPVRILYFTHTAGYRHDVIPAAGHVLQGIGETAGFQITASEDVAVFTRENLLHYGAIMFFTTGELPMS